MLYTSNENFIKNKTADRFSGSEAVFLMNKLHEKGWCIDYTGEEVAELYGEKKVSERKVAQGLINGA